MRLVVLSEVSRLLQCPNCGKRALSMSDTATCPRCHFKFQEEGLADQHSGDGLTPPYTQFSQRYGGKFVTDRSGGITTTPHSGYGETNRKY